MEHFHPDFIFIFFTSNSVTLGEEEDIGVFIHFFFVTRPSWLLCQWPNEQVQFIANGIFLAVLSTACCVFCMGKSFIVDPLTAMVPTVSYNALQVNGFGRHLFAIYWFSAFLFSGCVCVPIKVSEWTFFYPGIDPSFFVCFFFVAQRFISLYSAQGLPFQCIFSFSFMFFLLFPVFFNPVSISWDLLSFHTGVSVIPCFFASTPFFPLLFLSLPFVLSVLFLWSCLSGRLSERSTDTGSRLMVFIIFFINEKKCINIIFVYCS